MIRALCLDFDGTLAHRPGSFQGWLDSVRADLGLLHCDFNLLPARLADELGRDGAVTVASALEATLAAFDQHPDPQLADVIARALGRYAGAMALLPGALELLDWLRDRDLPLALITNGPADMQRAAVAGVGLTDRFRGVFVSGDAAVAARKPAARPFALACGVLGCPPGEVLMVGDNARADVLGALAHGMQAVRVGGAGGEGFEGVPDLPSLRRWLEPRLG